MYLCRHEKLVNISISVLEYILLQYTYLKVSLKSSQTVHAVIVLFSENAHAVNAYWYPAD